VLADTVAFDTMATLGNLTAASQPNTIMGEAFSMSGQVPGPVLSGVDVRFTNTTGADIVQRPIRLTVYLWNSASLATSGSTLAFSDLVRTEVFDVGTYTLQNNTIFWFNSTQPGVVPYFVFSSPVTMGGATNLGISFRWQVNNGAGFTDVNGFSTAVRFGTAPEAGANALGAGYYRNNSGSTDGDFLGSDFRQVSSDSNLAFRLFAVPSPGTLGLAMAWMGFAVRRRRRESLSG
jgi:hypothetical protein